MPASALHIELPNGYYEREAMLFDKEVNAYDERLRFGKNLDTGQWCIFMVVRGEDPLPVLGFSTFPTKEGMLERLKRSDSQRRGKEILDEIRKHNDAITKGFEDRANEASGEAAEAFETGFRIMGKHPSPRIFVPSGKVYDLVKHHDRLKGV